MWCRFSISTLGDPPFYTLGVLCVLGCEFSSYLVVGSLCLIFLNPFGFVQGGVVGVGGVIMAGLNCGKHFGTLSGPLIFTLRAGSISRRFISFISAKILTRFCKAKRFPSPIYLIIVACAGFSKTFLYWWLHFWWILLLIWRAFWSIVEKINRVFWLLCSCLWGVKLVCAIGIHKGSNVKPRYLTKCLWPALSWILVYNCSAPWWSHWCPIKIKCSRNHVVWW